MRFCTLSIDGYGRFSDRKLDLSPGLQVIVGPNEQGKSTVRNFIVDMLYGQKRSAKQPLHDPTHELRRPWLNPDRYGGRAAYQLDDGRIIEVVRNFNEKDEFVGVYDRGAARDITDEFERLGNREPTFALTHLGLTKDVFVGTATFSHVTLDELNDRNALAEIREKLLSIADSGEESSSAEMALNWLANRVAFLGLPAAANRPLPAAKAKLHRANDEYKTALALRDELVVMEQQRRALLEEEKTLRRRRVKLLDDLAVLERVDRAERLKKAVGLTEELETATQRCFQLGSLREFPLHRMTEVQRAETALATIQAQLERKQAEYAQLRRQIDLERERLGIVGAQSPQDVPEEVEIELAELESRIARLRDRLEETNAARDGAAQRLQSAQTDLDALPDFGQIASDPVEWAAQLSSSFRVAVRAREEESAKRDALREGLEECRASLEAPQLVFAGREDFPTLARDYELGARTLEEQLDQRTSQVETLEVDLGDYADRLPGFLHMAIVSMTLLAALLVIAYATGNWAVLIPAALTGLGLLWFLLNWAYIRHKADRAGRELETVKGEVEKLSTEGPANREVIESMMNQAQCATVREIEALYDQYRETAIELAALEQALEQQETRAKETQDYVTQLLEHHRLTFAELGTQLNGEDDVDNAASQTIARYQEYRDAKRRMIESKELVERRNREAVRLSGDLDGLLKRERGLSLGIRAQMRAAGYAEESKHESALRALRSFRIRAAQLREKSGRIAALEENAAALEKQVAQDEEDLSRYEADLAVCLKEAGVDSVEAWRERAGLAREYQEVWDQRISLEKQLEALLQGQDLTVLRAQVEADGPPPDAAPAEDIESLRRELETITDRVDALQREEHTLHVTLAERAARTRSLNEVEEERAVLERRVEDLELEMRAAAYAMAQIEEVARDKHSRIAPRLASIASGFLSEITAGAYEELLIDRDLRISVRIPQTNRMDKHLEQRLSKGAVDQIYLALRLAMVRLLSENRESIPILLDDPFTNYDDERLEHTVGLLSRIAADHQILLFTCREDVVRAGKRVDASVVEL